MNRAPVDALELVVIIGDGLHVHPLPSSGSVSLGRAEGNAVHIEHPSVSRKHAVLHLGPQLQIEDLGSANHTIVRDHRVTTQPGETVPWRQVSKQSAAIRLGDSINLGSTTILVRRVRANTVAAIVRDPKMLELYDQARRVASTTASVLLLGETGVGKEVLAREIHSASMRAKGPFLAVNCAAIAESLLESELFGHEKGAFTGALQARPGLFEAAGGGTLFLDELGELPLATQAKLLRVLQEKQVLRVGARAQRDVDVRFVSATKHDLAARVKAETFREDLFYRVNTVTLMIPPLRDRRSEIAPLAHVFVEDACRRFNRGRVPDLPERTVEMLQCYDWPGNVRELCGVIERAVALCVGDVLEPDLLPAKIREPPDAPPTPSPSNSAHAASLLEPSAMRSPSDPDRFPAPSTGRLQEAVEATERQRIIDVLADCNGNQTLAARRLGISRRALIDKMTKYKLPRPRKVTDE